MSKKKRRSSNTQQEPSTDKSPYVHQNDKLSRPIKIRQRSDLTDKQKEFLKLALDNNVKIIFLSGPAGSSKSFLSVLAALELINLKKVSDIIYVRSVVESSDSKMGYLPGDAKEKLSPYIEPLLEKLDEMLDSNDITTLLKEHRVQGKPIGYLRGLSWNAKAVILDEAQNTTFAELVTAMTRIGEFSKMFICGDPMQSDINGKSGYATMCELFNNEAAADHGVKVFYLTNEDIVRSAIVKYIVETVQEYKKKNPNIKK